MKNIEMENVCQILKCFLDLSKDNENLLIVFSISVFSLFSVVTFKNSGCRSTSGTTGSGVNRNGTCYTRTECQNKGGTAGGSCAAG